MLEKFEILKDALESKFKNIKIGMLYHEISDVYEIWYSNALYKNDDKFQSETGELIYNLFLKNGIYNLFFDYNDGEAKKIRIENELKSFIKFSKEVENEEQNFLNFAKIKNKVISEKTFSKNRVKKINRNAYQFNEKNKIILKGSLVKEEQYELSA